MRDIATIPEELAEQAAEEPWGRAVLSDVEGRQSERQQLATVVDDEVELTP